MRIGIDIRELIYGKGGIHETTYQLVKSLLCLPGDHRYFLYSHARSFYQWGRNGEVRETVYRIPHRSHSLESFWRNVVLPLAATRDHLDVLLAPGFVTATRIRCKRVIIIHDLIFELFAQFLTKERRERTSRLVREMVRLADAIVVPSRNTREDLMGIYEVPAEKIHEVPLGVSERYHPVENETLIRRVRERYGLPESYILNVGTVELRKNIINLVKAYGLWRQRTSLPQNLVIVGRKDFGFEQIRLAVERLGLTEHVRFTAYVPEDDLPLIYNGASLFVFPSYYEGFGLPPLEAMACGIPVVSSHAASLPEVLGDAARYVAPENPEEIAEAMVVLTLDAEQRQQLKHKGLQWSQQFTWEQSARRTLAVLEATVFNSSQEAVS